MKLDPKRDPLYQKTLEAEQQARREDEAAKKAAAVPMPGPLRDAFLAAPDIQVGDYKVRPLYDMDVEVLQAADHPLYKVVGSLLTTGRADYGGYIGRGPDGWLAAWMLTEDVDTVDAAWRDGTAREKAKAKFGRSQIALLVRLADAVTVQVLAYADTMLPYAPERPDGGADDPPRQPEPSTGSGGSSTSGAS